VGFSDNSSSPKFTDTQQFNVGSCILNLKIVCVDFWRSGSFQQSAGMDAANAASSACALSPSASGSLATSASFTSRDSEKDQPATGDDFISSCGILSVMDVQPQIANVSQIALNGMVRCSQHQMTQDVYSKKSKSVLHV
jgi:hypothetical protein